VHSCSVCRFRSSVYVVRCVLRGISHNNGTFFKKIYIYILRLMSKAKFDSLECSQCLGEICLMHD